MIPHGRQSHHRILLALSACITLAGSSISFAHSASAAQDENTALKAQLAECRQQLADANALAAQKMIEKAKGLLMAKEGLTEGEAFTRLRIRPTRTVHSSAGRQQASK